MPLFEITADAISSLSQTTFEAEGIAERAQLRCPGTTGVGAVDGELFVVAEEVSHWEDSKRRIDILALDSDANLVVIELKRTEDGGHMELQALRYAAMISALTFEQVVQLHADHRNKYAIPGDAREHLLAFLGWDSPREDDFAESVRIVLVSADFSKELTTTVLWLNGGGPTFVARLRPYKSGARVFVDAQQVIPLPEAARPR